MTNVCWQNFLLSSFCLLQALTPSYSTLEVKDPTTTRFSTSNTTKADAEFFVGKPAKYKQLESQKCVTPKAVYLEKEEYSIAKDGIMQYPIAKSRGTSRFTLK